MALSNYLVWALPLLFVACSYPPTRLQVVQVGDCYVGQNKSPHFNGAGKTCFFALKGWRGTPAQLIHLDSLAAEAIRHDVNTKLYEDCGVIYFLYDDEINEHTEHSISYNSILARGNRIVSYSWNKTGEYSRILWDGGEWLADSLQKKPSVVVDVQLIAPPKARRR